MAEYTNDLRLKEIGTGESSGTWGTETNTNLELIAEAFSFGTEAITTNADTHTTTIADGSTDPGRSIYLKYTGTLDSACTITIGPNTVSKLWFIENGTSGSQNIIISQGSGANVTIPAGHVKAVYSDGAGSGAAMVDAFTNLNLGGTTTVDDLTITDDLTVTDDLIVNGDIDLEGNMDINGSLETDALSLNGTTVSSTAAELNLLDGSSANTVVNSKAVIYGSSGELAGTLSTAAQTNITSLGTLTTLTVDDITINGSTISDAGNLTLDVGGDIILDAGGDDITFKSGGTEFGGIFKNNNDMFINSAISDGDIKFRGNDGGSFIIPLTLDMSNAGRATFNENVIVGGNLEVSGADVTITSNIIHAGDTNTFFGFNDADTFRITTGGSEAFRVDSSQQVGIGTTSPSEKLHISGTSASGDVSARIVNTDTSSATSYAGISLVGGNNEASIRSVHGSSGLGALSFFNEGAERMIISNTGNLGIGTSSPGQKLDVAGNITADAFIGRSNISVPTGDASIFRVADNTLALATASTERMRIDSSGNVGIGTTTIRQRLHQHVSDSGANFHAFTNSTTGTGATDGLVVGIDANEDGLIWNHENENMLFATNNTERMRIDSSGNLLVGTTTSEGTVTIEGDASASQFTALAVKQDSSGHDQTSSMTCDIDFYLWDNNTRISTPQARIGITGDSTADQNNEAGGQLCFYTNIANNSSPSLTERMRIDSSGNVGIGTASPQNILHTDSASTGEVVGLALSNSNTSFTANEAVSIKFGVGSSTALAHGKILVANTDSGFGSNGYMAFHTRGSDSVAERMRIDSSGNVGIGTASPATDLHIASATPTLTFTDTDNNYDATIAGLSGSLVLKADANDEFGTESIQFHTGGSQRAQFDSSGGLLIGTTTRISDTNNGGASFTPVSSGRQRLELGHTSSSTLAVAQFFGNSSETAAGNIACSGGACDFNTSSDARRKNVLGEAKGLEVINKLNPVHFEWKESKEKQDGLIAQEVEPVVSNAVSISDDGYYVMDYSKLVTPLIKAVQEQQEQIESLRSEIAILKGE